jgi:hypothetical protein
MTSFNLTPAEIQFMVAFRLLPASQQEAISTTVLELALLTPDYALPDNVTRLHA